VIHLKFDALASRRVVAMRRGQTPVGSLWLIGEDEALAPETDEILQRAAAMAALRVSRAATTNSLGRRNQEASVLALLQDGKASSATLDQLGLPSDGRVVVVSLEPTDFGVTSPVVVGPHLADLLALHLNGYRGRSATTIMLAGGEEPRERVYVLAACSGPEDLAALKRIVEQCVDHARTKLGLELRAGIGHEVDIRSDLTLTRRSAEDCLTLGQTAGPVATFEQVHDEALLREVDSFVATWRGGSSKHFELLAAHDAEHATHYVETVRALLDTFGDVHAVGERLGLQVNSVRYRVKRISEIAGFDPGDGAARLALELTMRARQHTAPAAAS
jgi:sugar diacid utilization regulator